MKDTFERFIHAYHFEGGQAEKVRVLGSNARSANPAWQRHAEIIKEISSLPCVKELDLYSDGSIGNSGNWLTIPYIRVFDKDQAPSPSKGVYICYLFSEDGTKLYLTLSLGGSGYEGRSITIESLAEQATIVREQIKAPEGFNGEMGFKTLGNSKKAKYYDAGVILHKEYHCSSLPSDEEMQEDLQTLCHVYRDYLDHPEKIEKQEAPVRSVNYPRNLVYFGAPGTGKTYQSVNQAVAIIQGKPREEIDAMPRADINKVYRDYIADGHIVFVTFHQSYSYEDFVQGIYPEVSATGKDNGLNYIKKDGVFKVLCDTAKNHPDQRFVMIIDEINRGNISKIFGELITLIEDSKRLGEEEETTVLLPLLDNKNMERFGVPNNVYIIGTMNTADRSIQHIDTALRRRFVFEEVLPEADLFSSIDIVLKGQKVNVANLLNAINRRIKRYFDREHVIGHAYFIPLLHCDESDRLSVLGEIFRERVLPLLQDYFFEDYSRIQKVLGESEETPENESLIHKVSEEAYEEDDGGRDVYEVAPKGHPSYLNIATYLHMME